MAGLKLVIGNKNYSSWSMRPWLALRAGNIPFEETFIPLYTGAADKQRILDVSPAGKVPVLVDGDVTVWDSLAIKQHPEWACVRADGSTDPNATSTFGPYVDALLIPQVREVLSTYDLDGIWMDGDCWAAKLDYSPAALQQWKKATTAASCLHSAS